MRDLEKMPAVDGFKLRKCPFCGNAAPKLYSVHGLFMVGCPVCCGCSGIQHSKEKAVLYWNQRGGQVWEEDERIAEELRRRRMPGGDAE